MDQQDWELVVLRKYKAGALGKPKSQSALNEAVRSGASIQTQKKFAAGSNKVTLASNARALDDETEAIKHRAITHDFKIALLKARQNKNFTQKQLAQMINEKPTVISDYETGKAIPNGQIIAKLNKVLGVILPKIPKIKLVKEKVDQ